MTELLQKYSQIFAIAEIEVSKRLQALFWVIWALCIYDLDGLSLTYAISNNAPPLWEHLQNFNFEIEIGHFPDSYDYTKITAMILSALFAGAYFAIRRNWRAAHFFLLLVLLWKFVWTLVLFDYSRSNFDYFHLIPALVFLFSHQKLNQMRFVWALLYFFTPFVKMDEGWIAGTYFSSLKLGLPLMPDSLIPFATNAVIILELLGSVALLTRKWSRASLVGWTAFHLYSTILVGFFYPVRCLLMLWGLFGFPQKETADLRPLWKTGIASWIVILYVLVGNLGPSLISPNPNQTFEAMNYGLHMINANHQCLNKFTTIDASGSTVRELESGSLRAMTRCYPQHVIQNIHRSCREYDLPGKGLRVQWQLWHSKDGHPFYEIVNVPNACEIQFQFGQHNEWIKLPQAGARLVGYPEKNSFYPPGMGPLPKVHDTVQITFSDLQNWILQNLSMFRFLYLGVWSILFMILFRFYFRSPKSD